MKETIIAQATPRGVGGVSIVRISGAKVFDLMKEVLGKVLTPGEVYVGNFYDRQHRILDQGIALFFRGPYSFTGEDVLELQGHGGILVVEGILDALLCWKGIRLAEPGEFSKRAFLNGRMDLTQAEAVADLIHAETKQAVHGALRSLRGEFSTVVRDLSQTFLETRSLVEAVLDFDEEEEIKKFGNDFRGKIITLLEKVESVLNTATQGVLNQEGLHVVIAGEPNAGKSSLFNWLCGEERAIVTDQPGTTRDLLREVVHMKGMLLRLIDTAGLRDTEDLVEQAGVSRAKKAIDDAEVVLWVQDIRQPLIFSDLQNKNRRINVFNKIDLVGHASEIIFHEDGVVDVYLSVKERNGLEYLLQAFHKTTGLINTEVCSARQRHVQALKEAKKIIEGLLSEDLLLDLVAGELHRAHREIMTITGEVVVDDLLDQIFSKFCIGK